MSPRKIFLERVALCALLGFSIGVAYNRLTAPAKPQLETASLEGMSRPLPESSWEALRTGPLCFETSNGEAVRFWHPTDGECRLQDAPAWGGQFAIDFIVPQESVGGDDRTYIRVPPAGFVGPLQ